MNTRATGALGSLKDYRDGIATAAMVAAAPAPIQLPATLHTDLGTVLDQNKIPACVAHDVVYLMRRYWFKKTGKWIDFSPRFLDILAKRTDGVDRLTGGTYPRLVLKLATQYGCATTATLPNDTNLPILQYRDDSVLTDKMFADAAPYKIPGYLNIPLDFATTRNSIYLYDALTALFSIGSEFWLPSWMPKDIDPLRTPETTISGHQLALCGWDDAKLNRGRNEWGPEWDRGGEFHYDPIVWKDFIHEQWAIAEVPNDVSAFLKALPSPSNFHYQWNKNLTRGDYNDDVKMAQVAFMITGYLPPVAPAEFGYFGPKTGAANLAYQIGHGITSPSAADIGPRTRASLNATFAI